MSKNVIDILEDEVGNKQAYFICPGCGAGHAPYIEGKGVPVWGFNKNLEKPTLTPSIMVRSGNKNGPTVCHSFVTDGNIKFLGDCTHSLKNKTVPLSKIDSND
jgi:hypothetical protein